MKRNIGGIRLSNKFLREGSGKHKQFLLDCDKQTEYVNNAPTDLVKIQKVLDVRSVLTYMCSKAVNLKILTQMGDIYEYIHGSIYNNKECCIELILQLDSRHFRNDIVELDCFAKAYELLDTGKTCDVYASYSYICDEKIVGVNYVISDKGVLVFNVLGGKDIVGFYTEKQDVREYYEVKFNKWRDKCYTYATSTRQLPKVTRKTEKVLDNVDSNVTFEICKVDNRKEMWIMNNQYIRIMELSMIELFDKYMDEYAKD